MWLAVNDQEHAFVHGHATSVCGGFGLRDKTGTDPREHCRACEIELAQLW